MAFREATEETGLKSLKFIPGHDGIFDLDVHPIPAHGDKPLHDHYDIRIILSAEKDEPFVVSHESNDLKWILLTEAPVYNADSAFRRLIQKAQGGHFTVTPYPIVN